MRYQQLISRAAADLDKRGMTRKEQASNAELRDVRSYYDTCEVERPTAVAALAVIAMQARHGAPAALRALAEESGYGIYTLPVMRGSGADADVMRRGAEIMEAGAATIRALAAGTDADGMTAEDYVALARTITDQMSVLQTVLSYGGQLRDQTRAREAAVQEAALRG